MTKEDERRIAMINKQVLERKKDLLITRDNKGKMKIVVLKKEIITE